MRSWREITVEDATSAAAPIGITGAVLGPATAFRPPQERLEACAFTENKIVIQYWEPGLLLPLKEHPEKNCKTVLFILAKWYTYHSVKRFRTHHFAALNSIKKIRVVTPN